MTGKLTRRGILGALCALAPLAHASANILVVAGGKTPTAIVAAGAIPFVAPGAGWTGVENSGGVPTVFPGGNVTADPKTAGVLAAPAVHWLCPSFQVMSPTTPDLVIGVDADAGGAGANCVGSISGTTLTVASISNGVAIGQGFILYGANVQPGTVISGAQLTGTPGGAGTYPVNISQTAASGNVRAEGPRGVKQIDFYVEGAKRTITTPGFYSDTDARGNARTRYGFWIRLRYSDFAAHNATGSLARLYAEAIPNDPTMTSRVIGYDLVGGGQYDGNHPMYVCPRATTYDHSYTVNAANNDVSPNFTTPKKAVQQAIADGAERPRVTFKATANYEAENGAVDTFSIHSAGAKAPMLVFDCDPSVTATINRAAPFTPNAPATWNWIVGWDAVEFRGKIDFQCRNWASVTLARGSWFNGARWTNSIGVRNTNYWNNGAHPGVQVNVRSWFDDCNAEYVAGMYLFAFYAINSTAYQTMGSVFTSTHYVYNTYVRDYSNIYYRQNSPRIRFHYNSAVGGGSTATVERPAGANVGTGQSLLLKVNGSVVATIPLGLFSTDTNPTVQDVANAVNAVTGWTATILNPGGVSGGIWAAALIGQRGGDACDFTGNAFNVDYSQAATLDPHGEWMQTYTGGAVRYNVLIRNNILRDNDFEPHINNDADHLYDFVAKGCIWLGIGDGNGPNAFQFSRTINKHWVMENCTTNGNLYDQEYDDGNPFGTQAAVADKVYSRVMNCVLGGINVFGNYRDAGGNTYRPNGFPVMQTAFRVSQTAGSIPDGPYDIGNVQYDTAGFTFDQLVRNTTAGDVRPVLAGFLLSHMMPKINDLDGLGLPFAANDVVGAWSKDSPAKVYAF